MLVQKGANLFLYDYENQAPLHVAKRRKRQQLFKYFKLKMKEDEPAWKCDVEWHGYSSPLDDTTSTTSSTDVIDFNHDDIDDTKSVNDVDDDNDDDKFEKLDSPQPIIQKHAKSQPPSPNRLVLPKSTTASASNPSPILMSTPHSKHNELFNTLSWQLPSESNHSSNHSNYSNHSHHSNYSNSYSNNSNGSRRTISNNNNSNQSRPRLSPNSSSVPTSSWHAEHEKKLEKLRDNKLKMVLKIEQSNLNKEVIYCCHRFFFVYILRKFLCFYHFYIYQFVHI